MMYSIANIFVELALSTYNLAKFVQSQCKFKCGQTESHIYVLHKFSLAHNISFWGQNLNHHVNLADQFSLLLPQRWWFLGPEIMKKGLQNSRPRN